jgi:hypothetical protein
LINFYLHGLYYSRIHSLVKKIDTSPLIEKDTQRSIWISFKFDRYKMGKNQFQKRSSYIIDIINIQRFIKIGLFSSRVNWKDVCNGWNLKEGYFIRSNINKFQQFSSINLQKLYKSTVKFIFLCHLEHFSFQVDITFFLKKFLEYNLQKYWFWLEF